MGPQRGIPPPPLWLFFPCPALGPFPADCFFFSCGPVLLHVLFSPCGCLVFLVVVFCSPCVCLFFPCGCLCSLWLSFFVCNCLCFPSFFRWCQIAAACGRGREILWSESQGQARHASGAAITKRHGSLMICLGGRGLPGRLSVGCLVP